jgi:hypothetical protein
MYAKIIDHPNLVRDMDSNAVLNVNVSAKENFVSARDIRRKEKARLDTIESKMDSIENLLKKVLDKLG